MMQHKCLRCQQVIHAPMSAILAHVETHQREDMKRLEKQAEELQRQVEEFYEMLTNAAEDSDHWWLEAWITDRYDEYKEGLDLDM